MSKSLMVVLLVALVGAVQATSPTYNYNYNGLCHQAGTRCSASSSLRLQISGPGRCIAQSSAYCAAFASTSGQCFDADSFHLKTPRCYHIDHTVSARCFASAAVAAYTETASRVLCNGRYAFGCTNSRSEAYAIACGLAQAVTEMTIKLGIHKAKCEASIAVAIKAIAEAAAGSQSQACSSNGALGFDHDKNFAYAAQKVLAEAFATCWLYCDGSGVSATQVSGGGQATIVEDESNNVGDNSDAGTGGVPINSPTFSPNADLPSVPGFVPIDLSPGNTGGMSKGTTKQRLDLKADPFGKSRIIGSGGPSGFRKVYHP